MDPLGAHSVARDRAGATLAAHGHGLAMPAVVAGERRFAAMHDERHVALRTPPEAPAIATGEKARPAAPVEQHDPLAAGVTQAGERVHALRMQARRKAAHVEHAHRRQRPTIDAMREAHGLGRAIALRPRRRAAEHEQRSREPCPLGGHRARVVAGIALVLVGGIVLLVDHDQAEVLDRREDRRARADADARLPGAKAPPLVVALPEREARVEHGDRVPQALDEAPHHLRRERYLGNQHDRPATLLERAAGGAQVELGLARPRDAVQQQLVGGGGARGRAPCARTPAPARRSAAAARASARRRRCARGDGGPRGARAPPGRERQAGARTRVRRRACSQRAGRRRARAGSRAAAG